MPYTWINEPPIIEMTEEEVASLASLCWDFWDSWDSGMDPESLTRASSFSWEEEGPGRYFAYMLGGKLIGAMTLAEQQQHSWIRITSLMTHPGSTGAGSILIEHAVNLSEKAGYEGRLGVMLSINRRWRANFEAKGFVTALDASVFMTLAPSHSDRWVKVGGSWRLKKHQVRSPLDKHTWRELTIEAQIGRRLPARDFRFLS
jgi:GNAT superfamily N-acetyltransferase